MTRDLFVEIESVKTDIRANAASDLRTFRRALNQVEAFRQLSDLAWQPETQAQIARRFVERIQDDDDEGFRHRGDVALSAYLMLLAGVSSPWIRTLRDIAGGVANTWWLQKVAADLPSSHGHGERLITDEPVHLVFYDSSVLPAPLLRARLTTPEDWDERITMFEAQWPKQMGGHLTYWQGDMDDEALWRRRTGEWTSHKIRVAADSAHFEGWIVDREALFPTGTWHKDSTNAELADVEIDA